MTLAAVAAGSSVASDAGMTTRLTASAGAAGDQFGSAVAVDGNTAVVGAEPLDGSPGFVSIFEWDGQDWHETQTLTAPEAKADHFGRPVLLEGNRLFVSATGGDIGGAIYVYTRVSDTWTYQEKLVPSNPQSDQYFGVSLALEGNTLMVGAVGDDLSPDSDTLAGAVYEFGWDGTGWTQRGKLVAPERGALDHFGASLALEAGTLIVGASLDDTHRGEGSGSAYVFERSGDSWTHTQTLVPGDAAPHDRFGHAVVLEGDTAMIGAYLDDTTDGVNSGSVRVYTRSGGSWLEQQQLVAADGAADAEFGASLALDGINLLVGSPAHEPGAGAGAAYRFTGGSTWTQQSRLAAPDGANGDWYGHVVALKGKTMLIGVPGDDTAVGDNAGSAYALPFGPLPTGTTRVSVDSAGNQTTGLTDGSEDSAISGDGRFVAFTSDATNLVQGDTNLQFCEYFGPDCDVFIHDRVTGLTKRASISGNGAEANGSSLHSAISEDGRFVAFSSLADNLVGNDTNHAPDVFVHDAFVGSTTRVNLDHRGEQASAWSWGYPTINADGRFVAFVSSANLVPEDRDPWEDVYVRDLKMRETALLSPGLEIEPRSESRWPSVSDDGGFVVFESTASHLVPNDTNVKSDIFVVDRVTRMITRINVGAGGVQANDHSFAPAISGDGRFIVYDSAATNLVPSDTNGKRDVFIYDRQAGVTTRVNVDGTGRTIFVGDLHRAAISDDGQQVAFAGLRTGDPTSQIWVRDGQDGTVTSVSVDNRESDGDGPSSYPSLSADGRYVAFDSAAENLVSGDTNVMRDVFVRDRVSTDCALDAGILSVGVPADTAVTIVRSGDAITVNGAACPDASVGSVDSVSITGTGGNDQVTVDLSGGPLGPGATAEGTGVSEIEVQVDLGAGTDTLVVRASPAADKLVLGSAGANLNGDDDSDLTMGGVEQLTVAGGAANDTLTGAGGLGTGSAFPTSLTLLGEDGNDILTGGLGADDVQGGAGNDTFKEAKTADGADALGGGAGSDIVTYAARGMSLFVSLDGVANDGAAGENDNAQADIEKVTGGMGNDTITDGGQVAKNTFKGGKGSDTLDAQDGVSGNDVADGGAGTDGCTADTGDTRKNCEA